MNTSRNDSIELFDASGFGLRVDFELRQDRWIHGIAWRAGNRPAQTLLTSVEGTSEDRWPSSPPFQELVIDPRLADRTLPQGRNSAIADRVALLLGRGGSGHWSASFELWTDPIRLMVDVACRSAEQPEFIGSTYQAASFLECSIENCKRLELGREADAVVALSLGASCVSQVTAKPATITICPQSIEPPATWRWCYAIAMRIGVQSD